MLVFLYSSTASNTFSIVLQGDHGGGGGRSVVHDILLWYLKYANNAPLQWMFYCGFIFSCRFEESMWRSNEAVIHALDAICAAEFHMQPLSVLLVWLCFSWIDFNCVVFSVVFTCINTLPGQKKVSAKWI